jgi:hypothetical protein
VYGSERWTFRKAERHSEAAQMRLLKPLVTATRRDHVQNEESEQAGKDNMIHEIGKCRQKQ